MKAKDSEPRTTIRIKTSTREAMRKKVLPNIELSDDKRILILLEEKK